MSQTTFAKRVAVTGGAGFIGSHLIAALVAKYPDTLFVNIDCLTYAGDPRNVARVAAALNYAFERVDIADAVALDACWRAYHFTDVIHLAAETHVDRSILGPAAFMRTNVIGTFNLLENARAASEGNRVRFLHVSTDEVYGPVSEERKSREGDPFGPRSPYAASKAAGDHLVQSYHSTYGLDTVVTRSCNNYGPNQFPEKLIPLMITNGLQGRELPVYGDGLQVRDWLHVDDHCAALEAAWLRAKSGTAYNIGGGHQVTNLDLVHRLCTRLDDLQGGEHERLVRHVADRPGHDRRYALDCSLIERDLGWRPRMTLEDGLDATVRWYREHESWWRGKRGTGG